MSKSAKGCKATAPVIDNQSTDDDISNLFSTQLKGVLNSTNRSKLTTVLADVFCESSFLTPAMDTTVFMDQDIQSPRMKQRVCVRPSSEMSECHLPSTLLCWVKLTICVLSSL